MQVWMCLNEVKNVFIKVRLTAALISVSIDFVSVLSWQQLWPKCVKGFLLWTASVAAADQKTALQTEP